VETWLAAAVFETRFAPGRFFFSPKDCRVNTELFSTPRLIRVWRRPEPVLTPAWPKRERTLRLISFRLKRNSQRRSQHGSKTVCQRSAPAASGGSIRLLAFGAKLTSPDGSSSLSRVMWGDLLPVLYSPRMSRHRWESILRAISSSRVDIAFSIWTVQRGFIYNAGEYGLFTGIGVKL
jgi:hypothetical protein